MKAFPPILCASALALLTYLLIAGSADPVIRPMASWPGDARWIESPGPAQARGYFRLDFDLPPVEIERAWIAVAADVGMETVVNGNPVGRWTAWRATRPFQSGHSEYGQRARLSPPALALNFPREHQWSDNANWRLPPVLDLTTALIPGQINTLAIRAESRDGFPSIAVTGEVLLASGERIPLQTNTTWKASSIPGMNLERGWVLQRNSVADWSEAREVPRPPLGTLYSAVPSGAFSQPFSGHWVDGQVSKSVSIDTPRGRDSRTWLRVLATGDYLIKINGRVVRPLTGPAHHPAKGDWIAAPSSRRALAVSPELLDPAEALHLHSGAGFLVPGHGDPTANDFERQGERLDLSQDSLAAKERGDLVRRLDEEGTRRGASGIAESEAATARLPLALNRSKVAPNFSVFDVTPYLSSFGGTHDVEVVPLESFPSSYAVADRLAWDVGLTLPDGSSEILVSSEGGRLAQPGVRLRFYRTAAPSSPLTKWLLLFTGVLGAGIGWLIAKRPALWTRWRAPIAVGIVVALSLCLLTTALGEKSEELWFLARPWWRWLAAIAGILAGTILLIRGERRDVLRSNRSRRFSWIGLFSILVLSFVLRSYALDLQAMDDDEYASVQATLSIAKKGLPELSPGIYYTRSPAYHYLAAVFVKLFGPNLWALRLPAILAGVASVFMAYLIGSRVFRSRGVGLAAAFLLAVHPFAIFTSHVARFYQQQQLCALVLLYFFVVGFVQRGPAWTRAATIAAFALGVLSQEISLVLVVPLCLCYVLMARRESWGREIPLGVVCILWVGLIGMNLVAFKVICLTRLEGISPNAESTLKPHFWEPLNFLSLWIGYGRLHIFLAPFTVIGMMQAFRRRQAGPMATTFFLLTGVAGIVLLVTGLGFRYQYALLPLWLLLGVYGIRELARLAAVKKGRSVQQSLALGLVALCVVSWCPWRIWQSYDQRLLGDSSGATSFVRANLRSGDKVAITEPHPHAALLEIGQADYDLVLPILYDFVYRDPDGRLIDRNGGAEVMGRSAAVQQAMAKHDRLWFVVNREKFRNRNRNHRWEYPGARVDFMIKQNCQLAYQGYLWDVYLWDRDAGHFATFRTEPMAWNE